MTKVIVTNMLRCGYRFGIWNYIHKGWDLKQFTEISAYISEISNINKVYIILYIYSIRQWRTLDK